MRTRRTKPWAYFYSHFFGACSCPASELSNQIEIIDNLLAISDLKNPTIVSIGSGVKDYFALVFEWKGFHPIFTDYSNAPLLLLKSEDKSRKTKVVNAKNMPFENESVDVFTEFLFFAEPSLSTLDHKKIAKEIQRVLKKEDLYWQASTQLAFVKNSNIAIL